jgi:hypothetical protein
MIQPLMAYDQYFIHGWQCSLFDILIFVPGAETLLR